MTCFITHLLIEGNLFPKLFNCTCTKFCTLCTRVLTDSFFLLLFSCTVYTSQSNETWISTHWRNSSSSFHSFIHSFKIHMNNQRHTYRKTSSTSDYLAKMNEANLHKNNRWVHSSFFLCTRLILAHIDLYSSVCWCIF